MCPCWRIADLQQRLGDIPAERIRLNPPPGYATGEEWPAVLHPRTGSSCSRRAENPRVGSSCQCPNITNWQFVPPRNITNWQFVLLDRPGGYSRSSTKSIFSSRAAARSLLSARASIWRIRSFVTPSSDPTSLSVSGSWL